MNNTGIIIKYIRVTLLKLTQKEFSKKLDVDRSYISQLENNQVNISLSKFIEICVVFKIEDRYQEIFNAVKK